MSDAILVNTNLVEITGLTTNGIWQTGVNKVDLSGLLNHSDPKAVFNSFQDLILCSK